jgi:hypothetical protein
MRHFAAAVAAALFAGTLATSSDPPFLTITFPNVEAGLPSIFVGGVLWAASAPIILGAGGARCNAGSPTGSTTNGAGSDAWGALKWTETPYMACGTPFVARVTTYASLPAVTFTVTFPSGASATNMSSNTTSPLLGPIASFPSFPSSAPWPGQRNFAWPGGQLGFKAAASVTADTFQGQTGNVPSPFFFVDTAAGNATLVVAPLDHMHGWACNALASISSDDSTRQGNASLSSVAWGCGIMNTVPALQPGFSSTTLLFAGEGVTATLAAWGSALRTAFNTTRLPDIQTSKLGIYTDNGAFYNNIANFAGHTAPEVFVPMVAGFNASGVPVKYIMLDDW